MSQEKGNGRLYVHRRTLQRPLFRTNLWVNPVKSLGFQAQSCLFGLARVVLQG